MNRKVIKIVSILLMVLMVVMTLSTSVFATGGDSTSASTGSFESAKMPDITFSSSDTSTTGTANGIMATLISVIQIIGMGVAIIMLVVMAIKYVSAAPSEKAELKKSLTIYIVGAIVLFAASGILQVVKNFADNNINNTQATSYVEMVDDTYLG